MSDLDNALAFIREEIEVAKACAENPETDEVVKNYRRVEVLLMQQAVAEAERLRMALNYFLARDFDKPTHWKYGRDRAEELAFAALAREGK